MSCQASFDVTSFWRQGSWWLIAQVNQTDKLLSKLHVIEAVQEEQFDVSVFVLLVFCSVIDIVTNADACFG